MRFQSLDRIELKVPTLGLSKEKENKRSKVVLVRAGLLEALGCCSFWGVSLDMDYARERQTPRRGPERFGSWLSFGGVCEGCAESQQGAEVAKR